MNPANAPLGEFQNRDSEFQNRGSDFQNRGSEFQDRVSETELERLVEGHLSDRDYRRVVARLEQEPDGWRRCCLAFLEHQALRADLGLLGGFPFDSQTGLREDGELGGSSADHLLSGDNQDWAEEYPRPFSRSNRAGRQSAWLRGWLQSPLQNPLAGFAVVVAASVLVYAAINGGREPLRKIDELTLAPSQRAGLEDGVGFADNHTTSGSDPAGAGRDSSNSGDRINDRVQYAVVRSGNDLENTVEVPLEKARPSDSLSLRSRSVFGTEKGLNSSLDEITKPYRVERRLFLSVLPDGRMALIPVEVIRIKAYQ